MYHTCLHIVVMGSAVSVLRRREAPPRRRAGDLVARGAHLDVLKRPGLAIRSATDGDTLVRLAVVERLEEVDRADGGRSGRSTS